MSGLPDRVTAAARRSCCNLRSDQGEPGVTVRRFGQMTVKVERALSILVRALCVSIAAVVLLLAFVYGVSEWKMRRSYDAPLVPLRAAGPADPVAGMHVAKLVGCWAGCHGRIGEGGFEQIKGVHKSAAPTLSQVLPRYSDEELVRLIRYGVKRDGRSAIGMISYATWALGDQDLLNVIAHLRAQPLLPPVPRSHEFTLRGRWLMATGKWGVDAELVDRSLPRWGQLPRNTPFERGRYLASIVCTACHGRDFRGSALEDSPPLAVVAGYTKEQFRHLLRAAVAVGGRDLPAMSWVRGVDFSDREIDDLYAFLREHHGVGTGTRDRDAEPRPKTDATAPVPERSR